MRDSQLELTVHNGLVAHGHGWVGYGPWQRELDPIGPDRSQVLAVLAGQTSND
jgi:hypothetical protein